MLGKTISHYQIVESLGEGGMGVVYKARDSRLDRFVAIKILSDRVVSNPERRRRFIQEAKSASALNHPNIITVYDIDMNAEFAFIAMEYVEGKTLAQLTDYRGPLRLGEALRYSVQMADALATAHAAGIVHRDIKPANVMVTEKGLVKVLDFGLAKLADIGLSDRSSESELTATMGINHAPQTEEGTILGTVAYMSPEQAQGQQIDGRSDIFSFGAVLYEMVTGRRAFRSETKMATLAAIINQDPPPAGDVKRGLPREIERIIIRCLRKEPARRFQNMADLKVALEELKEEYDYGKLISAESTPVARSLRKRFRRRLIVAGLVAAILLVSLAGFTRFYLHSASNLQRQSTREDGHGSRLRLLVSSTNRVSDPALSSDGKMIAYVAEEQGHVDLFVARVAGGGRVRLTNDDMHKSSPHFSPDGERIVFTRLGSENGSSEVWAIPTLGGQATRLVSRAADANWSPDGARMALVLRRPGEPDALAIAAADGANVRTVLGSDPRYPFFRNPAWSPDGTQLAVVRSAGGISGELWLVPLNGKAPRRLSHDAPGVSSNESVFTADGRGLVHQSNRAGATNLWILPLDDRRPVRLTTGPGPDVSPSVSRDGSVAFANTRYRSQLILQDLSTGQTRELLTHSAYIWSPAFSPDRRDVAFSRAEMDGSWHIWIAPVQGGPARQLSFGELPEIYPRFSPDGAFIIYHTWSAGPDRIWRVPRAGGPPVALTPAREDDDAYGDISPDGRWLAFARTDKEATRIYISSVAGGEVRRLTISPSTLPHWSPDGRWIVFSSNRGLNSGVFVISANGTGMRRLSETGSWPIWWPGGERIGYTNIGPDGAEQILTTSFAGGPSKALPGLRFKGTNNPFDVSSDGTLLATSSDTDISSEIWLLEPQR